MRRKKILILCPSPKGTAATQRLKYEQYLGLLESSGYDFTISSFQTERFWKIIYKPGNIPEKVWWTVIGYLRRVADLFRASFYDAVFVNLWVTPIGTPFFEKALFFFNPKVIYDIDDMLFIDGKRSVGSNYIQRLKGRKKPIVLMKHSEYVITCTPKLEEIAKATNKFSRATDISATFNTERFTPVSEYVKTDETIIGWTGTHSTLPFLESLQPVLSYISTQRKIKLLVIANKEYTMSDVPTEFIPWNEETEVSDLHRIQIGLYPIPANEWSLGKSSLKALTYMAIAIPFVATAYGTNYRIMQDGVQGFMASGDEQWIERLIRLIDDVELRKNMGLAGRRTVEAQYSVKANIGKYLEVFDKVVPVNGE